MIHRPSWFSDDKVMVSTAPTCGLTKGGRLLPLVDRTTGRRIQTEDPETGELVDAVDDVLTQDMDALRNGLSTPTLRFVNIDDVDLRTAVPTYYDRRFDDAFDREMATDRFSLFKAMTLRQMIDADLLMVRGGHGSPTQSVRVGTVPYIKVSDLRAGLVNINPTNRVPHAVATQFWRGDKSGFQAWDLICPERTSKNIGDFCMIMPGQEQVVATKEVIVLRPGPAAQFDSFFLMWALSLNIVRDQWRRVIFMQTNREDVGSRYLDIRIPVPKSGEHANDVAAPFRNYYQALAAARTGLATYLDEASNHHFFIGSAIVPDAGDAQEIALD